MPDKCLSEVVYIPMNALEDVRSLYPFPLYPSLSHTHSVPQTTSFFYLSHSLPHSTLTASLSLTVSPSLTPSPSPSFPLPPPPFPLFQAFFCSYLESCPSFKAQELLVMHYAIHNRFGEAISMQARIKPLAMVNMGVGIFLFRCSNLHVVFI